MINILKTYYRIFKSQKLSPIISIGGLALSLSILVLLLTYVMQEYSVDKHYKNIDTMYRVYTSNNEYNIPLKLAEQIVEAAPEIENLSTFSKSSNIYTYDNKSSSVNCISANEHFFDLFDIEIINGQKQDLLSSPENLVITQSFALKLFGTENPIGKFIKLGENETKVVKAVIKDPSKYCSLEFEVIFNNGLSSSSRTINNEKYYLYSAVLLLNKKADAIETEAKIADLLAKYEGYDKDVKLKLQPFKEIYFNGNEWEGFNDTAYGGFKHANLNLLKLLTGLVIIILVLSVFNFINLSTAWNIERFKEVCIRKTSGASRSAIFTQFVLEALISCFIALIISFFLASLFSPMFTSLINRDLKVYEAFQNPYIIVAILLVFVVTAGFTAVIPSLLVAKYNPVDLLKKSAKIKTSRLHGLFSIFQLTVVTTLIVCFLLISKQVNYVKTKDLGFNKEYLLTISLYGKTGKLSKHTEAIKQKLLTYPQILNVSASAGKPMTITAYYSGSLFDNGQEYKLKKMSDISTDTSFLSTFKIQLVQGRNFRATDKNVCFINEKLYKYLELESIEGKAIWGRQIVGVVNDFNTNNLHDKLDFTRISYNPEQSDPNVPIVFSDLNIRILPTNYHQTIDIIKSTIKEFDSESKIFPWFYDDMVNIFYRKEEQLAKIIKIFTIMAIVLACLGLLGIVEFTSRKRIKEIGIRKVNGAPVAQIMFQLNKNIVTWFVIAFMVAIPLAYYVMQKWLEEFAYKTALSWWIFALSGIIALGIALLTVSWQSYRAASRNPIEALRYE